jgi:hypothetical protein
MGLFTGLRNLLFGKPPAPPDYNALARQQGEENRRTAEESASLNRLDEYTPLGSVRYERVADASMPGGFRYRRDINLSPEQRQLYDLETGNALASQRIAGGMQGRLANSVRNPFSLSGFGQAEQIQLGDDGSGIAGPEARDLGTAASYGGGRGRIEDALYRRQMRFMEPRMEQSRAALDVRLRNQGLMPGSEAYNAEMSRLTQDQGMILADAVDRAIAGGGAEQSRLAALDMGLDAQRFGQAAEASRFGLNRISQALANRLSSTGFNNTVRSNRIQEALMERNQPLAEFNAFRTGNAPQMPQFQPYALTNQAPAPVFQGGQAGYDARVGNYNALMGFGQSLINAASSAYSRKP